MDPIQSNNPPIQTTTPEIQSFETVTTRVIPPAAAPGVKRSSKLKVIFTLFMILASTGVIAGTSWLISSKKPVAPNVPQDKPQALDPTPTFMEPTLLPTPVITLLPTPQIQINDQTSKVIMTVGSESIYQKDYDTELYYYPDITSETQDIINNKLIADSITLQIAKDKNIYLENRPFTSYLDNTVYNSINKDYKKRLDLINKVKVYFEKNDNIWSGYIVSLWYNNNYVSPLGYEQSKTLVYRILNGLRESVANKSMTIEEAWKELQNMTDLEVIDPSYKTNAFLPFSVDSTEKISLEPEFDTILKSLPVGGISALYSGKSQNLDNPSEMIDSYYMFGQIVSINPKLDVKSFEELYKQLSSSYAVKKL